MKLLRSALALALCFFFTVFAEGPVTLSERELAVNNWPSWRGPDWNGVYNGTDWDASRLAAPEVLWSADIGQGYATPSILRDRLYCIGRNGRRDRVRCFNALSGATIWTFDCKTTGTDSYPGPGASPLIHDGKVFTFGRAGELNCLDAATGKSVWSFDVRTAGAVNPGWDFSGSPRVSGDLLILNANQSGIALNRNTGALVWKSAPGIGGYATPVFYPGPGGRLAAAIFGEKKLYGVDVTTGSVLWNFDWETGCDVLASDPLFIGTRIFIASNYGKGCALLDIASGRPAVLWSNRNVQSHTQSHVFYNGFIYAAHGSPGGTSSIRCINPDTGAVVWQERLGFGSFIRAGDKLIYINESGQLTVMPAVSTGFQKLAQARVPGAEGLYWSAPVMAHGLLYTRSDSGRLTCINLRLR